MDASAADEPGSERTVRNGQAIGVLALFASLAIGVLLLLIFREVITPILTHGADRATDPQVQQANGWLVDLLGNLELVFVLISVFGLLALAVFRSTFAQ